MPNSFSYRIIEEKDSFLSFGLIGGYSYTRTLGGTPFYVSKTLNTQRLDSYPI